MQIKVNGVNSQYYETSLIHQMIFLTMSAVVTEKSLWSLQDEDDISELFDLIITKIIRKPMKYLGLPGFLSLCVSGGFWLWVLKTFTTYNYWSINLIIVSAFTGVVGLILILTGVIIKALNSLK
jgi:hypothetical protein